MKRADRVHRGIAKAVDLVIVGALCMVPLKTALVGVLAAALYILISDGFQGRSLGKRLIGVRVVKRGGHRAGAPCEFRESIIRNLLFAAVIVLSSVPLLQWIFFPLGVLMICVEGYFAYMDDDGIRVGDIFAGTQVTDEVPAGSV